ncbi:unnamed protein product [Somion occarium]|uniref:Uncharacterized protein n=1 Tax=Somion occarium TaxID=3059160 RepID=A0ABP1DKJ1_9APHY
MQFTIAFAALAMLVKAAAAVPAPQVLTSIGSAYPSVVFSSSAGEAVSSAVSFPSAVTIDAGNGASVKGWTKRQEPGGSCEAQAIDLTHCLEIATPSLCSFFLEQLRACQAASGGNRSLGA